MNRMNGARMINEHNEHGLYYNLLPEELVLENLSLDLWEENELRPRKILNHLIELEPLPGATARVAYMAMKLFEQQRERAASADANYTEVRLGQNEDQLFLACLHTALIWECG